MFSLILNNNFNYFCTFQLSNTIKKIFLSQSIISVGLNSTNKLYPETSLHHLT